MNTNFEFYHIQHITKFVRSLVLNFCYQDVLYIIRK